MRDQSASVLEHAEDHVREYEARVQRQAALVDELEAAGRRAEAAAARHLLDALNTTLDSAYRHLEVERRTRRR